MRTLPFPSSLKRALPFCVVALMVPAAALSQALPPASDVAGRINVGWNIGNSLEATGGETAWGNPLVSQQLINSVKAAGFNAVRIPVAWDGHANQSTLQIDPAWMARVKQVVDYAIGNDMYVILNIHWDGGWLEEHPLVFVSGWRSTRSSRRTGPRSPTSSRPTTRDFCSPAPTRCTPTSARRPASTSRCSSRTTRPS